MTSAAPGAEAAAKANAQHQAASTLGDVENPAVQSRVAAFQTHLRGFFDGALTRGAKYLPSMRDILVREGLPADLAYLPLIESGYRPKAVSPAGAAGPWQFIPETGRRYGLRIDSLVDERRDPIRSTQAASAYLKDLHEMFGDWELSLAAYNTGEYRVARILANKDVEDYWDMRERGYLPSETSAYVPKFLAAVQIAKAPEDYGFETPTHTPEPYEMVDVDRTVSLRAAADMCGLSANELAELNPALRSGITPSGYSLRVPVGKAEPLRIGLATYVEPVHPRREVVRSARGGRNGRSIAKGGRSTAVAQGKRSATRVARTAPQRYQRGRRDVQTARRSSAQVREAKLDRSKRTIERAKPAKRPSAKKPAKSGATAKPATKAASGKRRG
ncbi:MAG: lytic transglycosylase domain-containing protein [Deltaproteobacteria bacterium]|nr:lytic transglycosylase domain-containing protein [Deltaproteobacteria bacterium]